MVVTPGFTMAFTCSNTWRTMWPLRRIFASSAADLQTIMFNGPKHSGRHLLHRLVSVYGTQNPGAAVVIRQGQGLFLVGLQALGDHFFSVILARHKLRAIYIADFGDPRRPEEN